MIKIHRDIYSDNEIGQTINFKARLSSDGSGRYVDVVSLDNDDIIRTSNPETIFDIQNQYFIDTNIWDTRLSVSGSFTHLPNEGSIELSTNGNTIGNSAILQTKNYFRCRLGKSYLIIMSFLFGNAVSNVSRRVGYFDDFDGVFLEQNGITDVAFVLRSSTSGFFIDSRIEQNSWNIDKFDGSGASGLTIDFSKVQTLYIDLQWFGNGIVRYGFIINGVIYIAHQQNNFNLTVPYMKTANLPLRYSITNTSMTIDTNTMKAICAIIIGDKNSCRDNFNFSVSMNSALAVNTRRPILSIRLGLLFNGLVNRGLLYPKSIDVILTTSDNFLLEVVYNGVLSNQNFSSVNTFSMAEYDISATDIYGGIIIKSNFINSQERMISIRDFGNWVLSINSDVSSSDILSLVATHIGSGSGNIIASINWSEVR